LCVGECAFDDDDAAATRYEGLFIGGIARLNACGAGDSGSALRWVMAVRHTGSGHALKYRLEASASQIQVLRSDFSRPRHATRACARAKLCV
jgi:hypothetical protein